MSPALRFPVGRALHASLENTTPAQRSGVLASIWEEMPELGASPRLLGLGVLCGGRGRPVVWRVSPAIELHHSPRAPAVVPGGHPFPLVRTLVMVWGRLQGRGLEPPWWKDPRSVGTGGVG